MSAHKCCCVVITTSGKEIECKIPINNNDTPFCLNCEDRHEGMVSIPVPGGAGQYSMVKEITARLPGGES